MSVLPSNTYAGIEEPLYQSILRTPVAAVGPAGAIQYTDGAGNFEGNSGLVYDGVSQITNFPSNNSISLNSGAGGNLTINQATGGGILNIASNNTIFASAPNTIGLDSTNLQLTIGNTRGAAGQVLTSDGNYASWQPAGGGGGGNPATWSLYPATHIVDVSGFDIRNCNSLVTLGIGSSAVGPGPGITCSSDFALPTFELTAGNISLSSGPGLGSILDVTNITGAPPPGGGPDLINIRSNTDFDSKVLSSVAAITGASPGGGAPPVLLINSPTDFLGNTLSTVGTITGAIPAGGVGPTIILGSTTQVGNIVGTSVAGGPPVITVQSEMSLNGNEISNVGILAGVPPALGAPPEVTVLGQLNMSPGGIINLAAGAIGNIGQLQGVVAGGVRQIGIGANSVLNMSDNGIVNVGFIGGFSPGPGLAPVIGFNGTALNDVLVISGSIRVPGGPPTVDFDSSHLINVSTITGVSVGGAPVAINIDGSNLVNINVVTAIYLNAVGLVLSNSINPVVTATLTVDQTGVIQNGINPLIPTGLARPLVTDMGNTFFTIPVAYVTALSLVMATIQIPDQPGDQSVWLVNSVPGPGSITFNLAAPITLNSQLSITWFVSQI